MKMAKTLAVMMAVVLAVCCFNVPFAFGGEEHPWDEEGIDGGGINAVPPDDGDSNSKYSAASSTDDTAPDVQIGYNSLLTVLQVVFRLPVVM